MPTRRLPFLRLAQPLCILLLSSTGALSGCGHDAGPTAKAPPPIVVGTKLAADQTVTRAITDMPRTIDPSLATDIYAQFVIDDLFEGLTTVGIDGSMVPGVATSWETSADGKEWVFHLRRDSRWSNGDPVTAADFLYAWHRQVDPKTGSEYAQALAPIVGAMAIATGHAPVETLGVSAPDAYTIRISLIAPTPYLLALLADGFMQPLPRATIERYGDDWTRPEHIVSNGPFVLKELIIGDRITVEKNPLFWAAASVHPTRVVFFSIDTVEQVGRFMSGDIQFSCIFPPDQFQWLKSQLGDQVHTGPYLGIRQLGFNMQKPPFATNRNLRLAMTMAVDRDILADKVEQGVKPPAYSLVPPLPGYQQQLPAWASWSAERRHAEARRLYAAAGYSAAHPLRMQLDYPTDESTREIMDALAAMWRINLGAEIEPYNEEFRVLLQDLRLHKSLFFPQSWIGDYPDPSPVRQLFQTGYDENFGSFSDPVFDGLLSKAINEPDPARRYEYFEQAEARLNDQAVYIPFLFEATEHLIKPYLKGWQLNLIDRTPSRYMYVLEHEGN